MSWLFLLIGVMAGGPLWLLLARYWLRRSLGRIRRRSAIQRQRVHLAELGSLTGGLAHELKNPLSTIKVNLQLLIEDLSAPGLDQRHGRWLRRLQAVSSEVTRLQEVLDDFLRFAGKHELHLATVDIREVLSDLASFFEPQAETAGVRVRTHLPDEPLWTRVDVDLLKQAVLNLMINAQQSMSEGGELILKASRARQKMTIEIIDTGCGMPIETLGRVFEAYFTTKRGGTGLGLATVMRIIREHDGTISVDSEPGKGSRFVITLPAEKPAPEPARAE